MNKQVWLEAAKAAGIQDFEIYEQGTTSTSIRLFENSVDGFTISECKGIALRGIYHGKMGTYFLEEDNDELMDFSITQVKQNASIITSTDQVSLYDGRSATYPTLVMRENTMIKERVEDKISLLKDIEKALLESDPRITQVMGTHYAQIDMQRSIHNTFGMQLADEQHATVLSCEVMAKDQEDVKTAGDWCYLFDKKDFDVASFAKQLSDKVLAKLHADTIVSGTYPILMKNAAMCDLLSAICGMFNGELAHKGISILKEKLNIQVFSSCISIVDNPLQVDGCNSASFDDEGVACYKKYVVEKGVLKTYLHNLKSAQLMHTTSTGNGFKGGYAAGVSISPTNFYIEPGTTSYEDMIHSMDKGIIITDIIGLHAGLNTVSTDFSLQSNGFYVEHGQIVRPVNLITIAGNFMDIMMHIRALGKDLKMGYDGIGTPSIIFEKMAVSGK